jgi:hypothetical protein
MIMDSLTHGITNRVPNLQNNLKDITNKITMPYKATVSGITTTTGTTTTAANGSATNGGSSVINLFPGADIDFGKTDPNAVVQQIQNAIVASRM